VPAACIVASQGWPTGPCRAGLLGAWLCAGVKTIFLRHCRMLRTRTWRWASRTPTHANARIELVVYRGGAPNPYNLINPIYSDMKRDGFLKQRWH
jgi:hypothetical protein